ncbi:MAG: hypothetical protein ACI8QD_000413 [Cyclobacteriaceae bacterium]|jgi:hypothetical protein
MGNRLFKVILLLIIFGVPVIWYLFLQIFGENQFVLSPIRQIESACVLEREQVVFKQRGLTTDEVNQLQRLRSKLSERSLEFMIDSVDCFPDSSQHSLFLVDQDKYLRGAYFLTILEVDRLIVEADLIRVISNER